MIYLRTWLLFFKVLLRYSFQPNSLNPHTLAGKKLLSLSFRYPEKANRKLIIFFKFFVKSLLLKRIVAKEAVSIYGNGNVFFYETSHDDINEKIRLSQINYFTDDAVAGAIWKDQLKGYFTMGDKVLQLLFESLLFIVLLPLSLFVKNIGSLSLIFFEYVELVNCIKLLKQHKVKVLYCFSIYEIDSNISSLAFQRLGIKVIKITSLTPLKFWNSIIVGADVLAICDVNQFDELKTLGKTIQAKNVEMWGPENIAEFVAHYNSIKPTDTVKNCIGFYSTASYLRALEGNIDQYMSKNSDKVKIYLVEYLKAHPEIKLIIFPHPREKLPKYKSMVEKHYQNFFRGINYTLWDNSMKSAYCFEKVDLGVALYSSVMYERLYFGFKSLMMPFGEDGLDLPGEAIKNICATDKADFFAKIDLFLRLTPEEYFEKTHLKKSPFLLKTADASNSKKVNAFLLKTEKNEHKSNIVIIDYGLGNPASIQNMLRRLGFNSEVTSDLDQISKADKLILPGVGAFGKGMENLKKFNLLDTLNKKVLVDKTQVLGICLGMELMTSHSEEGNVDGLNWIPAKVEKFVFDNPEQFPVPHMGWADISYKDHWVFKDMERNPRYYFAHSYYINKDNPYSIASANYGVPFSCAIARDNITGVQFHPEKSHRFGLSMLYNFATTPNR